MAEVYTSKKVKKGTKKKATTTKKQATKKKVTKKAVKKTAKPSPKKAEAKLKDTKGAESNVISHKGGIEDILFKLPMVEDPLIGTPKQVQIELDKMAKRMQMLDEKAKRKNLTSSPETELIFNRIHLYMHGYLISVVLKQFPYIKGLQTVDIYQETLIALRFKALPGFRTGKGMSFLNFAKMCIRRHLITLLNTSKNRQKDQSINRAVSLDSSPMSDGDHDDGSYTFSNLISDGSTPANKAIEGEEAYKITKDSLKHGLSEFEQMVIDEYLAGYTYREIAQNIYRTKRPSQNQTKSIDNALLRIRNKAATLIAHGRSEDIPLFF